MRASFIWIQHLASKFWSSLQGGRRGVGEKWEKDEKEEKWEKEEKCEKGEKEEKCKKGKIVIFI